MWLRSLFFITMNVTAPQKHTEGLPTWGRFYIFSKYLFVTEEEYAFLTHDT